MAIRLRAYVYLWFTLTAAMAYEYWALNREDAWSLVATLSGGRAAAGARVLSTEAGRPISYFLGWLGFGLIALTNLYILRKKMPSPSRASGALAGWLDFHIFCGLFGPTCILFHSDFKVRGMVGISFWSMLIVVASGIVGQYIYSQVLQQKSKFAESAEFWAKMLESYRNEMQLKATDAALENAKAAAMRYAGLVEGDLSSVRSVPKVFFSALSGDIRLLIRNPATLPGMPQRTRKVLAKYAVMRRRQAFLEPFRALLGYWHSFHLPFAYFMYGAAILHIVAALVFRTPH